MYNSNLKGLFYSKVLERVFKTKILPACRKVLIIFFLHFLGTFQGDFVGLSNATFTRKLIEFSKLNSEESNRKQVLKAKI